MPRDGNGGSLGLHDRYLQPCFRFPQRGTFFATDGTTALVSVFYQQVGAALAFFTTTPTARS